MARMVMRGVLAVFFCRGWSCSPDSTPRTSENYTRLGAVRSGSDPRDRTRRASVRRRSPHAIASVLGWHRVGHIFALRLASQFQTRGLRNSDSPCSVNLALPRSEIGDAAPPSRLRFLFGRNQQP